MDSDGGPSFIEVVINFFSGKKRKVHKPVENEEVVLRKYRERINEYRRSFTPYNQRAPGFDYVSWKPYGYWRQEDHNKSYIHQCHALAPWVRSTADSGIEGLEEKRWMGLIGQPEEMIKSQSRMASRIGSSENLLA